MGNRVYQDLDGLPRAVAPKWDFLFTPAFLLPAFAAAMVGLGVLAHNTPRRDYSSAQKIDREILEKYDSNRNGELSLDEFDVLRRDYNLNPR